MSDSHLNPVDPDRRQFLSDGAAAFAAISSGALFDVLSGSALAADAVATARFDRNHLRWMDEVVDEVKAEVGRSLSGRVTRNPLDRMIKTRYDDLPSARKARLSQSLRRPSRLARQTSVRSAVDTLANEIRQPPTLDFHAPRPIGHVARRVGRKVGSRVGRRAGQTPPRLVTMSSNAKPASGMAGGVSLDLATTSNPHENAGRKYDLGNKYKSLEKVRDRHGRLLTRQRWRKGSQNSATYYMGPHINGGQAVALVGNVWTTFKSLGDAEGPLGAPLRKGRHDSGYYSGGVYIPTAKDPAVETFFGRMIFKNGTWRGELLTGFQLILNRITVDSSTGDDLNGFSDLQIDCYTTQGDVRVHGKSHQSFLYSGQVSEPHAVIGEANLLGNAAVIPGAFGYFIKVIEKDDHKIAEYLVKTIEEKLRQKLDEGAKKAGVSLAEALKVPALAPLLTELFSAAVEFVADKIFGAVQELFKDDQSDIVSGNVQLWSAWHPFKDPYWVKEINHNDITIHSGGKDGQIDLKLKLSRVWSPM
ncbi:hypothetical protein [Planctomycetes bacterium TBK1r]|uniref:Uncharacterized protein n=1 Tax=Stieleria magnilauensis TaxID=2527963 RepID=A0ABX5XP01_9BACT|nr:hypothetical protein TBK1r_25860 [Planctomycetes bacterium TBK1r]